MAIGNQTVTYTPFNKTSFGFGPGVIATQHPSLTNAQVTISNFTGNWDATGHISTPTSGNAISVYNRLQNQWIVEGTVAEVDAVLDALDFFPADYEDVRTWTPTALKDNVTSGSYINENPADTVAIPPTVCTMTIKDPDSSYSTTETLTVTFDATQPELGQQRPYWSVEPATEDLATAAHGAVAGGLVDLGTVSQGTDTDNIQVKCEFRTFGSSSPYEGSAFGVFTADTENFIGDKKSVERNNTDSRFNFTGSIAEVQAYLDNVRYYRNANETAFDMFITATNGVVGSTLTKTCYFSDATFTASTFPDQAATEETTFNFTLPSLTMTTPGEVDTFSFTMTFNATGIDGIDTIGGGALAGSGIYTSPNFSSVELMRQGIQNTAIVFRGDFDDDFTFTIEYNSSNATVGTSYTTTPQTVNVSVTNVFEIQNLYSIQSWSEDTTYTWSSGTYPQILHGYNDNFECRIQLNDLTAGAISATASGSGTATWNSPNLEFVGTRDEVNAMLQSFKFIPNTDYDSNFLMGYYQKRVSGDTTSDIAEGDYYNIEIGASNSITMNCTAHDEFSITQLTGVDWVVDNHVEFDSGLAITDLSYLNSDLPQYNTTYTAYCEMWDGAVEYTGAVLSTNTPGSLTITGNGHGQTTPLTMTGTRDEVNAALADLNFQPDCDETDGPEIYYRIVRDFDTTDIVTVTTPNTRTEFNNSINIDFTYTLPADYTWTEETVKDFDCGVRVVDGAGENSGCAIFGTDYTATIQAYWYDGSVDQDLTTATWGTSSFGSATVTGNGKSGTPLVIDGTREDVNTALENLTMTPDLEWTDSPAGNGKFYIYIDLLRNDDSFSILDGQATNTFTRFDAGTPNNDTESYDLDMSTETINEDTTTAIFSGKTVGVQDTAGDNYSNITYTITMTVTASDGSSHGEWNSSGSNVYTITNDTKTNINTALQNLQYTPTLEYEGSVAFSYTQNRLVDGIPDATIYNESFNNSGVTEIIAGGDFTYGTANSNIQYFVPSDFINGVDTTQSVSNILDGTADATLTPKRIALNNGFTYDRPINVVDTYEDGGPSQYKLVFSGGTLFIQIPTATLSLTDSGWQTKSDLNTLLDNGIYVNNFDIDSDFETHNTSYNVNFTLHRKTYTGTEQQIANGQLTYKLQTGLNLYHYDQSTDTHTRLDNLTGTPSAVNIVTHDTPNSEVTFYFEDGLVHRVAGGGVGGPFNKAGNVNTRILDISEDPDELYYFDEAQGGGHVSPSDATLNKPRFYQASSDDVAVGDITPVYPDKVDDDPNGDILMPFELASNPEDNTMPTLQFAIYSWTDWGVMIKVGNTIGNNVNLYVRDGNVYS